ncbi:acyltransferase [Acuticoccus kandeliae]|uniref:acyltransferase n=1 Tax=Acuticoccus kandeliae TaxID=2073160 RepID=UPI000D3E691C|nr:acyltransferase [Acuticoccus kandeliae]
MMTPALPRLRAMVYRATSPMLMRHVGRGTLIFQNLHLARPHINVTVGDECIIGPNVHFEVMNAGSISIGDGTLIHTGCHIAANRLVTIGSNVAIAEYVSIRDQEPRFTPADGIRGQGYHVASIVIEDNVLIGRGVYIGPGTRIRSGTIIAANSVVRGTFPPNVLLAGQPATVRRLIGPDGARHSLAANVSIMPLAHGRHTPPVRP